MNALLRLRKKLLAVLHKLDWLPALLLRAVLAAVFVPSGWGKLHSLDKVTAYFTDLHIPAPHFNAVLAASSEFVCGLALAAGLLTRLASIPLAVTMVVAMLTAKRDDIHGVVDLLALDEFVYFALAIALVVAGAGALSLDRLAASLLRLDPRTADPPKSG
jgi:putative oxidoreductase